MAQDPMSMFSQMWSGTTLPLMMSPEQLDKKIEELRLVQAWLKINLQMLDASLATMEMQRDARRQFEAAFQNMSASAPDAPNKPQGMPEFMSSGESKTAPSSTIDPLTMPAFDDLSAWWQNLGQEFLSSLKVAPESAPEPAAKSATKSATKSPAKKSPQKKSPAKKSPPKSV